MSMGDMDCGDNSCLFAWKKGGMRTNGGCRCLRDASWETRRDIHLWAQKARQLIKDARAEGEAAGRYEERRAIYAKASQMAMACDQGETPHGLDGAEAIRDLQDWMIKRGKCYEGTGEERDDGTP